MSGPRSLDPERWRTVRAAVERARELPPGEREAAAREACGGDPELLQAALELLGAAGPRSGFLEPPGRTELGQLLPQTPLSAGQVIGKYRLLEPLGRGAMGQVYLAEQEHPQRRVALKTIAAWAAGDALLRRFRRETEILGRLEHPGIARVYDAGTFDEAGFALPYLAMEHVEGARTLSEHAAAEELGVRERLELVRQVCAAVEHGHRCGVVHRDLKPANVLVGANGRPVVIDFGIAGFLDGSEATRLTETGTALGTLQYMAPEQLDAELGPVDARSDVYALGVMLYELLCGTRPHDLSGLNVFQAARVVRDRTPARPSTLRPELPRDLDWVVLAAMAPEPGRRYGSAAALADDLGRLLSDRPVEMGPPSLHLSLIHI